MIEIEGPTVQPQPASFAPTAGKVDSKLATGNFTCSCKFNLGSPCSARYQQSRLLELRMMCLEMTRDELDLVVL